MNRDILVAMEGDKNQSFQTSTHLDRRNFSRAVLHSSPKPTPWKSTPRRVRVIPGFLKYLPKKSEKGTGLCGVCCFQHFYGTNDHDPNKGICPCENSESWNVYFPALFPSLRDTQ